MEVGQCDYPPGAFFRTLRSLLTDDSTLETRPAANIGIAVDTQTGLTVPVIRNIGRASLTEVCKQLKDIAERTESRSLTADDFPPAAMTISNLGAFGITYFTPVLNPPESAILGVGALREVPVVVDGGIFTRWMIALSLTFDHRVVDGVPAAKFLNDLCSLLVSDQLLRGLS